MTRKTARRTPARMPQPTRLLESLNLFGLGHLDAVLLASLADERPLLLIGAHGTAKSELLNRVAAVLGLIHRHYNASLVSFDDLLGYAVPNAARDALEYLRTPGDLWDAESVFLDEISRCRPESQNKLFSVIHERRVQGLALAKLRYRWAAMNPPIALDGSDLDSGEPGYQGSLPLDPALADRFAWVVAVPSLDDIDPQVRRRLLAEGGRAPVGDGGLPALVESARSLLAAGNERLREWAVGYVDAAVAPLRDAQLCISSRRAVMLVDGIVALTAAGHALGQKLKPSEAAELTLRHGLPQRATGQAVELGKLKAVHKLALKLAGAPPRSTWRRLREEPDAVQRIAIALADDKVSRGELSELVSDAFASLDEAPRCVLARTLLPVLAQHDRVNAATLELLSEPLHRVLHFSCSDHHTIGCTRTRAGEWDRTLATVTRLQREAHPEAAALGNLLYALFSFEHEVRDPDALVALNDRWRTLFAPFLTQHAA